jgi:hypothetical protein
MGWVDAAVGFHPPWGEEAGEKMVSSTKLRRRAPGQYVVIGLAPDLVSRLLEQLKEEGAEPVRVDHDAQGSAQVFFRLGAWDNGAWLPALARNFGCGLASCQLEA